MEDETGIANLVVWSTEFEQYRCTLLDAGLLAARGRIQREGEVVHLVAHRLEGLRYEPPSGEIAGWADSRIDAIAVRTRDFRYAAGDCAAAADSPNDVMIEPKAPTLNNI